MATQLDHIILLVPHETLLNPPAWVTDHFTLAPGGKHADGKSENKLILFRDGTYLELIAFIGDDEKAKKGHWWGKKIPGLIDWAVTFSLTKPDEAELERDIDEHFENLSENLRKLQERPPPKEDGENDDDGGKDSERIAYTKPAAGGRILADGSQIRWKVAFPRLGVSSPAEENSLALPFLCYDVTARNKRVPVSDEKLLTHPCGATGVDQLGLLVSKEERVTLGPLMGSVLHSDPEPAVYKELHTTTQFEANTPSSIPGGPVKIVMMTPLTAPEKEKLELYKTGFLAEMSLRIGKDEKTVPQTIQEDGVTIKFIKAK